MAGHHLSSLVRGFATLSVAAFVVLLAAQPACNPPGSNPSEDACGRGSCPSFLTQACIDKCAHPLHLGESCTPGSCTAVCVGSVCLANATGAGFSCQNGLFEGADCTGQSETPGQDACPSPLFCRPTTCYSAMTGVPRCSVPEALGDVCDSNSDRPACAPCEPGAVCVPRPGQPPPFNGSPFSGTCAKACTTATDCPCNQGYSCARPNPDTQPVCCDPTGTACSSNADCCTTSDVCKGPAGKETCGACLANGAEGCARDSDCCQGDQSFGKITTCQFDPETRTNRCGCPGLFGNGIPGLTEQEQRCTSSAGCCGNLVCDFSVPGTEGTCGCPQCISGNNRCCAPAPRPQLPGPDAGSTGCLPEPPGQCGTLLACCDGLTDPRCCSGLSCMPSTVPNGGFTCKDPPPPPTAVDAGPLPPDAGRVAPDAGRCDAGDDGKEGDGHGCGDRH